MRLLLFQRVREHHGAHIRERKEEIAEDSETSWEL